MKIKIERDGDKLIPLTSRNGRTWSGGQPMTMEEMEEFGRFLVDFVKYSKELQEIEREILK